MLQRVQHRQCAVRCAELAPEMPRTAPLSHMRGLTCNSLISGECVVSALHLYRRGPTAERWHEANVHSAKRGRCGLIFEHGSSDRAPRREHRTCGDHWHLRRTHLQRRSLRAAFGRSQPGGSRRSTDRRHRVPRSPSPSARRCDHGEPHASVLVQYGTSRPIRRRLRIRATHRWKLIPSARGNSREPDVRCERR